MAQRTFLLGSWHNGLITANLTYNDVNGNVTSVSVTNNDTYPVRIVARNPRNGQREEIIIAAGSGTTTYPVPNGYTFEAVDDILTNIDVAVFTRWQG